MRLSAKILKNVENINCWQVADEWNINEGNAVTLCFQLELPDKNHIRYISEAAALSVNVTFPSIDNLSTIEKAATQPYADDKSIWCVELDADEVPGSGNVLFEVIEDGESNKFKVEQALMVHLLNAGGC